MLNIQFRLIKITLTLTLSYLLLFVVLDSASAGASVSVVIPIHAQEASLDLSGIAYEINPDTQGDLWISDDGADQIWQVNPASEVYTIYSGVLNASDAQRTSTNQVWWADSRGTNLVRLDLNTFVATMWTLPGSGTLWGVAIDDLGHIWSSDFSDGKVYRFTPETSESCTYPLPNGGLSDYVVTNRGTVWLADWQNDRILKLDPVANSFTQWQLPGATHPQGLAQEADGNLWWADEDQGLLARLEPESDSLTTYSLTMGTMPEMITLNKKYIWYTETMSRTIGKLDPLRASHVSATLVRSSLPITPICTILDVGSSSSITHSIHSLHWTTAIYTRTDTDNGWLVYSLPNGAGPWDITVNNDEVWAVDQDRHKLIRIPEIVQGTLAGHLFNDRNGNGLEDVGEPGLAGIQVAITDALGVSQTLTSNSSGNYTVTLAEGATQIDVVESTLPKDAVQTLGSDPTAIVVQGGSIITVTWGYRVPDIQPEDNSKRIFLPLVSR